MIESSSLAETIVAFGGLLTALAGLIAVIRQQRAIKSTQARRIDAVDNDLRRELAQRDKALDECLERCRECEADHENARQALVLQRAKSDQQALEILSLIHI